VAPTTSFEANRRSSASGAAYDGRLEVSMADSIRAASSGGPATIVEEGTAFKGTFKSTCPLIVNGRVEGDVSAPAVTVTSSGVLSGNVEAKAISCRGSAAGVFDADTIELSGAIAQNTIIRAQRLNLKIVSTSGKIELAFGQAVNAQEWELPGVDVHGADGQSKNPTDVR
jgi:cytoskeletal protein CcmA (bactofilin family)